MILLGAGIRRAAGGAGTLEEACRRIVHYLHESLRHPDDQRPDCVLVRFYRTLDYDRLPADLQEYARLALAPASPRPQTRCLTLMATAGDRPEWNSRHASAGHRTIPLPSTGAVERLPMIARLISQLGVNVKDLVSGAAGPTSAGRDANVFHVPEALNSPFIPAQDEFVKPHGVRSALGLGGQLTSGDLFAVILFSRTQVPAATARLFGYLTGDVKIAMSGHPSDALFDPPLPGSPRLTGRPGRQDSRGAAKVGVSGEIKTLLARGA